MTLLVKIVGAIVGFFAAMFGVIYGGLILIAVVIALATQDAATGIAASTKLHHLGAVMIGGVGANVPDTAKDMSRGAQLQDAARAQMDKS